MSRWRHKPKCFQHNFTQITCHSDGTTPISYPTHSPFSSFSNSQASQILLTLFFFYKYPSTLFPLFSVGQISLHSPSRINLHTPLLRVHSALLTSTEVCYQGWEKRLWHLTEFHYFHAITGPEGLYFSELQFPPLWNEAISILHSGQPKIVVWYATGAQQTAGPSQRMFTFSWASAVNFPSISTGLPFDI